ncbi:MAG TPA: hypothetical protein VIK55_00860 [Paludibacter sp.]
MEKQSFKTETSLSTDKSIQNASLLNFDLPTLVENIKLSQSWVQGKLNAVILLKSPEKQIVLTALHEDTEINSFQSSDSITVQIIEGKLKFHTRKVSVMLGRGQILTLHENIKYSMLTKEKTVFLLTIASSKMLN